MRSLLDLLESAVASLRARPSRTMLMGIGPLLGVAAIVGALGLSTSAKAEVRAAIDALGTDLVLVRSSGSGERLPHEAAQRARTVPGVAAVAALTEFPQVSVTRHRDIPDGVSLGGLRVTASDPWLATVADVVTDHGRFLNDWDVQTARPVVVLGAGAAGALGVLPGETRSVLIGDRLFGVVGVLRPVALMPELDSTLLVTAAAGREFDADARPSSLVVRVGDRASSAVAAQLDVAITYGVGSPVQAYAPSDLLLARAEIDRTLQLVILAMGALALLIGGLGITNVMTISVLQRGTEIGLRRALGQRRAVIAGQFLVEAAVVGLSGAAAGSALGAGFVTAVALRNGWLVHLEPSVIMGATLLATVVSLLAGSYPAARAARLEPSAALRAT